MSEPEVCDEGEKGLVLPLFGDAEQRWPDGLRIVLYFIGLMWFFMAVALIAEKFMSAIEKITDAKYLKELPNGRKLEVKRWNATVAGLTLLALGSSAPEIMLSVIELVLMNDFFSGSLGPSTIVGSAAFNLFVIIAVCIYVIPDYVIPEDKDASKSKQIDVRKIKEIEVYIVTASFSLFAYLWMLVVLLGSTPDIVDPAEGIVTFLFFPILVIVAYFADRGYFTPGGKQVGMYDDYIQEKRGQMSKEDAAELDIYMHQLAQEGFTPVQIKHIIDDNFVVKTSRAAHRVAATRRITGSRRVELPDAHEQQRHLVQKWAGEGGTAGVSNRRQVVPIDGEDAEEPGLKLPEKDPMRCEFAFEYQKVAVWENHGIVELIVRRTGNLEEPSTVRFKTEDGTAKQEQDYVAQQGELRFEPNEETQSIKVEIVKDMDYEEDEEFYVNLVEPEGNARLGTKSKATVLIIDDALPGKIAFPQDVLEVKQEKDKDHKLSVKVERRGGGRGEISCKFATEGGSAKEKRDFDPKKGTLVFPPNTMETEIEINIKARTRCESNECFYLRLTGANEKDGFCPDPLGNCDSCQLRIEITVSPEDISGIDTIFSVMRVNWDQSLIGHKNWQSQFRDAVYVNGGDEGSDASWMDLVMHIVLFPWKLIFALVPPTDFCGGWLCFGVSLIMIGCVTLVIGEMAGLLGCVLKIGPEITAITLVALGTSLPDTFASMDAAKSEPYADTSIVNVTGSNSVNVFLGLGLPWLMGSLYWAGQGQTGDWQDKYGNTDFSETCPNGCFVVEAGGLAFNTSVFTACAFLGLAILFFRRRQYGGELGGPRLAKIISSILFASLWFVYIIASIAYILAKDD